MVSKILLTDSGPAMSRLVSGLWRLREWGKNQTQLRAFIETCMGMGITTFDLADIYGDYTCESIFGRVIKENSQLREGIQIITKCGVRLMSAKKPEHSVKSYDSSRKHILQSVEQSLVNLCTDKIDLLLIHRPDFLMEPDETAETISELKQAGDVLHFGVSNFQPDQFDFLQSYLDFPLVTNQFEFSVLQPGPVKNGSLLNCQKNRICPMAWSPLGGGKVFDASIATASRVQKTMVHLAGTYEGSSVSQLALAWLLKHPANVVPVLGTGNIQHMKSAASAENFHLKREDWYKILEVSLGHAVP